MSFVVTGSPLNAFITAFKARCAADETLMAMIEGVFGHLDETVRTPYPYLVFGTEGMSGNHIDAGSIGLAGCKVDVQLDGWSAHKGKSEMRSIFSRVRRVFERQTLTVAGWSMVAGSLTCEFEQIDDDTDSDAPERRLYHGVQRWSCVIDEA